MQRARPPTRMPEIAGNRITRRNSLQRKHKAAHPAIGKHREKHRHLRCDCGQRAVTVLLVRVGTEPQYTIELPLCPDCLALEQSFHLHH